MKKNKEQINENNKINSYVTILNSYMLGDEIECRTKGSNGDWFPDKNPTFDFASMEYRVKAKPVYRPYINGNEAFTAMQEQAPFGWLYNTLTMCYEQVICIADNGISTCKESYSFDEAFGVFIYPNNSKFGIKLDEKV